MKMVYLKDLYTIYMYDGDREEGTYKNGKKEGSYKYYFNNGDIVEGTYKNGVKNNFNLGNLFMWVRERFFEK